MENVTSILAEVATILNGGNYEFRGIWYKYISSSSHVLSHKFRGVEIKYDRGQMESLSKGEDHSRLDIFAYYKNKCFQLMY